jgi:hypothetical protein
MFEIVRHQRIVAKAKGGDKKIRAFNKIAASPLDGYSPGRFIPYRLVHFVHEKIMAQVVEIIKFDRGVAVQKSASDLIIGYGQNNAFIACGKLGLKRGATCS